MPTRWWLISKMTQQRGYSIDNQSTSRAPSAWVLPSLTSPATSSVRAAFPARIARSWRRLENLAPQLIATAYGISRPMGLCPPLSQVARARPNSSDTLKRHRLRRSKPGMFESIPVFSQLDDWPLAHCSTLTALADGTLLCVVWRGLRDCAGCRHPRVAARARRSGLE